MNPNFAKLVKFERNGLVEQEHFGIVLHLNKREVLKKIGEDNKYKFYQRSCMKPLQLAEHIDLGLQNKFDFSPSEIAVASASHTGSLKHQAVVRSILSKIGLKESDLLCGKQVPLSKEEQNRLLLVNEQEKPIHNNCSGKHAAMLALCVFNGWSIDDYLKDSHPLNQVILEKVSKICNVNLGDCIRSKDGCGLPTIATTLEQLGFGVLNLFLDEKYSVIKNAFLENPYLIGGEGRLDSEIIAASDKSLIAKVGAGGLCVVVSIEKEEAIVVKIADANMQARSIVVIEAIRQLKWLDEHQISSNKINVLFDKIIKTLEGEIIGSIKPCFSLS